MTRARDLAKGTFSGDLTVDTNTLVVDSANNSVGIGNTSPSSFGKVRIDVAGTTTPTNATNVGPSSINLYAPTNGGLTDCTVGIFGWQAGQPGIGSGIGFSRENVGDWGSQIRFYTHPTTTSNISDITERMRIDSSGNLLVGTTSADNGDAGFEARSDGRIFSTATSNSSFNRLSSDGAIVTFQKDTSAVGSIGALSSRLYIGTAGTGLFFNNSSGAITPFDVNGLTQTDADVDLGAGTVRFDDIYAANGTIQTSDRNEKQDIDVMSEAETRVAVACKGLIRKFRWKDAVAEKGDDARIHFGIIAQDLQDAFAAEGLDAGRYAMFISSTWWETDRVVPAVEATDDTEAVAEHTVTDHYDTLEEAPEGATERTRLGVRYPELLAFIIGAL